MCVCIYIYTYTCVYIYIYLHTAGHLNLPATQRLISWNSRAGAQADRSQSSRSQRRFEHVAVSEQDKRALGISTHGTPWNRSENMQLDAILCSVMITMKDAYTTQDSVCR